MQDMLSRANEEETRCQDDDIERDRALELTLEVLRRRHAGRGKEGVRGRGSTSGEMLLKM